ncbi:MAG: F0F1 ATP synthase subunit gamma [Alphaproteobacteria bacterium]
MPNLKELKSRQTSVKATQKITRAMQMVAAAKLKRAQDHAQSARPYADRMADVMDNLVSSVKDSTNAPALMIGNGKSDTHLLIVATSDRGLCGAFNSNIVKKAKLDAKLLKEEGKKIKILCIGKKGFDLLKRQHADDIIDMISLKHLKYIGYSDAEDIGKKVIRMFDSEEFDVCTLYFAKFKSVMEQVPVGQKIIPLQIEESFIAEGDEVKKENVIYDYEPEETEVMEALLPLNINMQLFQALLENAASEQGSRMSAMDNATRNAGDMIEKLTLLYNRTRQAIITKELIEIISGAEAI